MEKKNNITELRRHLFETLEALKDREKPMEIDRAKAISDVAQTIINTAKVEVQYLRETGEASASEFLGVPSHRQLPAGNGHGLAAEPKKGLSTGKHLGTEA